MILPRQRPPSSPVSHWDAQFDFSAQSWRPERVELTAELVAAGIKVPAKTRCMLTEPSDALSSVRRLLAFLQPHPPEAAPALIEKLVLDGAPAESLNGVITLITLGVASGPGDTPAAQWLVHLARHGREANHFGSVSISLEQRFARLSEACAAQSPIDEACSAALFEAIAHNNRDSLCAILSARPIAAADTRDAHGDTALHHIARGSDVSMVWDLIHAGADANDPNDQGQTPLHVAAQFGAPRTVVAALIHARADHRLKDARGDTPTDLAQRHRNPAFIAALIDCGLGGPRAKSGVTALHKAALLGDDVVIEGLVMAKANVNALADQGGTPLHFAARAGHTSSVELIARNGAKLDARDHHGRSAAHEAAFHGHTAALVALLKKGADPHAATTNGATPLDEARRQRRAHTATVLARFLDPQGSVESEGI